MQTGDLDALAQQLLETLDLDRADDAFVLARRCGFQVRFINERAHPCVSGDTIIINKDRVERMHFAVLHELSHVLLDREELPNTEVHANALASALLLPRQLFHRDLKRLGWAFPALKTAYPNASYEAIGRRICSLRDATLWVRDVAHGVDRVWQAGKRRKLDEETQQALDWVCTTPAPWHSPSAVRVEEAGWVRGLVVG